MISTREVKIVIVATVQLPTDTEVPEASARLMEIMPNTLRELGYVPRLSVDCWETEDDETSNDRLD